jgi:hypothetical protein
VTIRLGESKNGKWTGTQIPKVSCAVCDEEIELNEDATSGDIIQHCGTKQKLSFEWGAFAAEKI